MQSGVWKADWFLGVLVVALFALFSSMSDWLPSLERKAYDAALQSASRQPSDKVAVIAIDKQSIDNIGRWPWPRDTHARMIELLSQAKARAIGYLVFFAEPENEKINRTLAKIMDAAAPAEGQPPSPVVALLKEARLFLGNESGPMHLAAAAGTPVVGLFGLTNPARWGPVGVPNICLRPSMPCECVASDLCKRTDPSKACCVWRLEVEPVVGAVREILSRTEMGVEHVRTEIGIKAE